MGIVLDWNIIIAFGAGLLILYFLLEILSAPLRLIGKLFLNVVGGAIGILILNFFGSFFGFGIAINMVTAFIVGFFGIPGVILLVMLKLFLGF